MMLCDRLTYIVFFGDQLFGKFFCLVRFCFICADLHLGSFFLRRPCIVVGVLSFHILQISVTRSYPDYCVGVCACGYMSAVMVLIHNFCDVCDSFGYTLTQMHNGILKNSFYSGSRPEKFFYHQY